MPADRVRRNKKTDQFDIVVIPVGQGAKSRSYRFSRPRLWLMGVGVFLAVFFLSLAGLIFTPLALVVPIPNSILEEKYGRQLLETQTELRALAQQVLRLGEYNRQLRSILGDTVRSGEETVPLELAPRRDESVDVRDLTLIPYSEDLEPHIGEPEPVDMMMVGESSRPVSFPFMSPVSGIISQRFDSERLHFGIDYASKLGTPVFAAAEGYIVFSGWTHDDGNMVIISHAAGFLTVYKHNQSLLKPPHEIVERGELIALLGSSGQTSTGPHLHFEVWKDGIPVDPEQFVLLTSGVSIQ